MSTLKTFTYSTLINSLILLVSEGIRNGHLLRNHWVKHFESLGQVYPEDTVNNLLWGVWIISIAGIRTFLSSKISIIQNTILCWFIFYPLAFLVMWNYNVLALSVLPIAIPWSFVVIYIMSFIAYRIHGSKINT